MTQHASFLRGAKLQIIFYITKFFVDRNSSFKQIIKQKRKINGLSQAELAERAGRLKIAKLLRLGKKKNLFFCFALDFS